MHERHLVFRSRSLAGLICSKNSVKLLRNISHYIYVSNAAGLNMVLPTDSGVCCISLVYSQDTSPFKINDIIEITGKYSLIFIIY